MSELKLHPKLKHETYIHIGTIIGIGAKVKSIKCFIDSIETEAWSGVWPCSKTVNIPDVSAMVLHGKHESVSIKPGNLKIVDVDKNEILVQWGSE